MFLWRVRSGESSVIQINTICIEIRDKTPKRYMQTVKVAQDRHPIHFKDMPFSDIKFKIHDKTLDAHKCILACKCTYFRAMFDNGMKESQQKIIEINNIGYQAFYRVIEYLYTDSLRLSFKEEIDLVPDIVLMAEMYNIPMIIETLLKMYVLFVDGSSINDFITVVSKLCHVAPFVSVLIGDIILLWDDLDRDSFVDYLMTYAPDIAKEILKRILNPKDVEDIKTYLLDISEKKMCDQKIITDFIASGDYKDVQNSKEFLDANGLCHPDFFV